MDRIRKVFIGLSIFVGVLGLLTGNYIIGGIMLLLAFAIHNVAGGGDYNQRNQYEKRIDASEDISINDIYDELKDVNTTLGKCWKCRYDGYDGECIVFGPNVFKDHIVIGKKGGLVYLRFSSEVLHLHYNDEDAYRLERIMDVKDLEVTPKNYSEFAANKVVGTAILDDLTNEITEYASSGKSIKGTKELGKFKMYHYDSSDSIVRDIDDAEYAKCSAVYNPLSVIVYDNNSNEIAKISDSSTEREAYNVEMSGKEYGIIRKDTTSKFDEYFIDTPDGKVRIKSFRAVRKANVSCNYRISIDGIEKAVVAGNAKIEFKEEGLVENNIICSFDNDFLTLYIVIEDFILTKNRFIK